MPRSQPLVTAEEFERIPNDGYHYELVRGRVIRVSPPGSRHGLLLTRISSLLARHVEARSLGVVISTGGFKLESNPDTVRAPDVAFVRRERIPASGVPDGYWPGPPDLAVEIRSPGDRSSEIREKVAGYLGLGVRFVGVVDSSAHTVTVHRPKPSPRCSVWRMCWKPATSCPASAVLSVESSSQAAAAGRALASAGGWTAVPS